MFVLYIRRGGQKVNEHLLDGQVSPDSQGECQQYGCGVQDLREVHMEQRVHRPRVWPVLMLW
jgi:hypothetical protein